MSIIFVYTLYELFVHFFIDLIPIDFRSVFVKMILIPYTLVYLYGLRMSLLSVKELVFIMLSFFLLFVSISYVKYIEVGHFVSTQKFKYPPTIYYFSYAFLCINLLYLIITKVIVISNHKIENIIVWLSSNSLWIYLWHIMVFYRWQFFIEAIFIAYKGTFKLFLFKFIFLTSFGFYLFSKGKC